MKDNFVHIPGFEDYSINESGVIVSRKRKSQTLLKPGRDLDGYLVVRLSNSGNVKTFRVHRLVMLCFLGPSDNHVNHKDFNKENNHISNLEYVTPTENNHWNISHGIDQKGERNGRSKLDWAKVLTIYTLGNHKTNQSLAAHFNVSDIAVEKVCQGKHWKDFFVFSPPVKKKTRRQLFLNNACNFKTKVTPDIESKILALCKEKISQKKVAQTLGLHVSTVERLLASKRKAEMK